MPESENSWDNIIEVSENAISHNILSGNVVLLTKFYADQIEVSSVAIRIVYV